MASQADEHAVVARNFPAAWLAANAVATLPTKVQSLLQRIGQLVAAPVVHQGATSLEAVARFQSAQAVAEAVKTLHGTDLRTTAEKRAANFEAPKDSERFWLQPLSALGAAAPKPATVAPAPAVSAVAAAPSATTSGPRKRLKPTGVYLSPLPPAWALWHRQDDNNGDSGVRPERRIHRLPEGDSGFWCVERSPRLILDGREAELRHAGGARARAADSELRDLRGRIGNAITARGGASTR